MTEPLYYGQNREDKWIAENLPLPDKGFYVDIGCGHPFTTSNTAFLRDRKWDGLAIDANPAWANEWKDIPAFQCAIIANDPEVRFKINHDNAYWSREDENGPWCKAENVEEFLDRHQVTKIDFLSVDTEGTEFDVLWHFNFQKHSPSIVVAEYNAAHIPIVEPEDSRIPDLMRANGYKLNKVFPPVNMIFSK